MDRSILVWGGIAGILAAVMTVLSLIVQVAFAPPLFVPAGANCGAACFVDASLENFPSAKAAMTVHNTLYFLGLIMITILVLSLYRVLSTESKSLMPALAGCGIGVLGLAMLAAGGIVAVSFAHLSDVYHAAAPQDQATLILVSQGVQAVYNETDVVGGLMLSIGFALFGVAMLQVQSFGRRLGLANITLSLLVIVGIEFVSVVQDNPNDPFFVIIVLVLPLLLGWKLFTLSKSVTRPA